MKYGAESASNSTSLALKNIKYNMKYVAKKYNEILKK